MIISIQENSAACSKSGRNLDLWRKPAYKKFIISQHFSACMLSRAKVLSIATD
jgi:hypothetical protein